MSRTVSLILSSMTLIIVAVPCPAQLLEPKTDLFSLELVQADLVDAKRLMTIHDPDENGYIDKAEQKKLSWQEEVADFDLNKDGRLTHLEVAIRQAKLRDDAGITAFDLANVQKFLQRHDRNRNGQLDPDEIENGGWPAEPKDYDQNKDGTITKKEMAIQFAFNRGLRREMGIEAIDQTGAMQFMRYFDQDGDKKLDADERVDAPLPKPAKSFDENNDGKLGIQELATMLARHRRDAGLTKPDTFKIRRLFERFDPEHDGTIDLNASLEGPFDENVLAQLQPYDTDKNGTITIAEVEKIVAEVRKQRGYTETEFTKAKTMLTRHDSNRSKHIEESELHEKTGPGQLPKTLIKDADLDNDGKVSLDELARYFAKQGSK